MSVQVFSKDDLRLRINQLTGGDLEAVQQLLSSQFRNPNEFVQELCTHVSRYQGKRIRPILLLLSARLCGVSGDRLRVARTLAAVVELVHTATLTHDDVIDDADLRRHVSTVHRRWNVETSVLLGDYLFSKAFHLAATTGDALACQLIGRATNRTCEGELNQIACRMEESVSERDYFRVIFGKTAQLFAVSCQLGGRAAGASEFMQRHLRQFGMRLGLAFQIIDDVLDLTESRERTGKDAANDLQNGRLTLPLLRALKQANPSERRHLRQQLIRPDMHSTELSANPMIQQGVESAHATAEQLICRCLRNLERLPDGPERSVLESLARIAVCRSE